MCAADRQQKRSVLFVCMGNICRSPTGEGVMKRLVAARGVADRVLVDSAGTISYHAGERPDRRMRAAAERRGYTLDSRARQLRREDLARFDMLIAMDESNHADILALDPAGGHQHKVFLLSEFLAAEAGWPRDVPDPYYGGSDGFDRVLEMIEAACAPILERLLDR